MKVEIFKMYQDISIGKNEICRKCNESGNMEKPLSLYYVGDKFKKGADTILFVGKTAVGGENFEPEYQGDFKCDLFTDATKFGEKSLDLIEPWSTSRPFYHYTYDIVENYYETYEKGKCYIGLTNIVKCNNTTTEDTSDYQVKEFCINELGVIWKESGSGHHPGIWHIGTRHWRRCWRSKLRCGHQRCSLHGHTGLPCA